MTNSKQKWILVSNRLPFSWDETSEEIKLSSGGLVTALSGIHAAKDISWVGIAPDGVSPQLFKTKLKNLKSDKNFVPVTVSEELYDKYYNGMCNATLWPLLHYEGELADFRDEYWNAYSKVNQLIADKVLEEARADDLVWIHDFHLFLLPRMLKRKRPNIRIGLFLHTPFPNIELFRQLPVRREILHSLLHANLLGFHDYSYLRHFTSTAVELLGADSEGFTLLHEQRRTRCGVFPVSIDTPKLIKAKKSKEVRAQVRNLERGQIPKYLILGVDRLDHIKGIDLKLRIFQELLRQHPSLRGQVQLMQITVPSRVHVPAHRLLKEQLERLVGEIQGEFGYPGYSPVSYMFSSVDFAQLIGLYSRADVLLVTSKRDGMNLVALEYIASQPPQDPGVVVLSEFAGAISTLSHVMRINPWDISQTAQVLHRALTMQKSERISRNTAMVEYLKRYTATSWAESFMDSLSIGNEMESIHEPRLIGNDTSQKKLVSQILSLAKRRKVYLLLDYDGTLVPIEELPELAVLPASRKKELRKLIAKDRLEVIIVSGRERAFLQEQLDGVPIWFAPEHGARFVNAQTDERKSLVRSERKMWRNKALEIMADYTFRVPESFVEKKRYGVAWHYRKSPAGFAEFQARKLRRDLESVLGNFPATVISGKKVVEVKAVEASKGSFCKWFATERLPEDERDRAFFLAFGDDKTDETMFEVINASGGVSIKVGDGGTTAKFRIANSDEVWSLLDVLGKRVS